MSNPQRYINRMILFLVVVLALMAIVYDVIFRMFMYNPYLNGFILFVLLCGIAYAIKRTLMLNPAIRWIDSLRTSKPGYAMQTPPPLLAPVASALGEQERRGRIMLPANSVRYLLDSIASRLDESRDIIRYGVGLLIFLGLLGTFWGLLGTIGSVGEVIAGLTVADGDIATVFDDLKAGLVAPMAGMGTAFSSSLFGLASSLVLGFLELQATQGQNAFYNEMEEWLSSLTRLSGGEAGRSIGSSGDVPIPAYLQALMEQTAENLQNLQRGVERSEENQRAVHSSLVALTERLTTMGDQIATEQALLGRLISNQDELRPVLSRLAEGESNSGMDDSTRNHIRNMDVYLARLLDETVQGRSQMTHELRSEIKMVARTIAAAAAGDQGAQNKSLSTKSAQS
jgi:hypothetical protein